MFSKYSEAMDPVKYTEWLIELDSKVANLEKEKEAFGAGKSQFSEADVIYYSGLKWRLESARARYAQVRADYERHLQV